MKAHRNDSNWSASCKLKLAPKLCAPDSCDCWMLLNVSGLSKICNVLLQSFIYITCLVHSAEALLEASVLAFTSLKKMLPSLCLAVSNRFTSPPQLVKQGKRHVVTCWISFQATGNLKQSQEMSLRSLNADTEYWTSRLRCCRITETHPPTENLFAWRTLIQKVAGR